MGSWLGFARACKTMLCFMVVGPVGDGLLALLLKVWFIKFLVIEVTPIILLGMVTWVLGEFDDCLLDSCSILVSLKINLSSLSLAITRVQIMIFGQLFLIQHDSVQDL